MCINPHPTQLETLTRSKSPRKKIKHAIIKEIGVARKNMHCEKRLASRNKQFHISKTKALLYLSLKFGSPYDICHWKISHSKCFYMLTNMAIIATLVVIQLNCVSEG